MDVGFNGGNASVGEPEFVDDARKELVDQLVAFYDKVVQEGQPHWVALEAPTGWGKSRLVQEFYKRLAAERQPDGRFWPPAIVDPQTHRSIGDRRKRSTPTPGYDEAAVPAWMWWGVECGLHNGAPLDALANNLRQFEVVQVDITRRWKGMAVDIAETAFGEALSVGLSATNLVVPGLGFLLMLAKWGAERGWKTVQGLRLIEEEQAEHIRLSEKSSADICELSRKVLPVVVFIEDLHLADPELIACLASLLGVENARVLLVTTSWGGHLRDESRLVGQMFAAVVPTKRTVWTTSGRGEVDLVEMGQPDMLRVLQSVASLPADVEAALAGRYRNPLAIQLASHSTALARAISSGRDAIEVASRLPVEVASLYRAAFDQLPKTVQHACMLAAMACPAGVSPGGSYQDARWDPALVVSAAESIDWLARETGDLHKALKPETGAYDWVREVTNWLRRFHEQSQLDLVRERARAEYQPEELSEYFDALLSRMSFVSGSTDERMLNHALLVIALEAEGLIERVDTWGGAVMFYCERLRSRHSAAANAEVLDLTTRLLQFPTPRELTDQLRDGGVVDEVGEEAVLIWFRLLSNLQLDEPGSKRESDEFGSDRDALASIRAWLSDPAHIVVPTDASSDLAPILRYLEDSELLTVLGEMDDGQCSNLVNLFSARAESMVDVGWSSLALDEMLLLTLIHGPFLVKRSPGSRTEESSSVWLNVLALVAQCAGEAGRPAFAGRILDVVIDEKTRAHAIGHSLALADQHNRSRWRAEATGDLQPQLDDLKGLLTKIVAKDGPTSRNAFVTRKSIATLTGKLGHHEEARALHEELLRDLQADPAQRHDFEHLVLNGLATQSGYAGEPERAIELLLGLAAELGRSTNLLTAQVWWNLSFWYQHVGDLAAATEANGGVIECLRYRGGHTKRDADLRKYALDFARTKGFDRLKQRDFQLADVLFAQAFDLSELERSARVKASTEDDEAGGRFLFERALIARKLTGDESMVADLLGRALELEKRFLEAVPTPKALVSAVRTQLEFGMALRRIGEPNRALKEFCEARQKCQIARQAEQDSPAVLELLHIITTWAGLTSHELGVAAAKAQEWDSAEDHLHLAVDMRKWALANEANALRRGELAVSLLELGAVRFHGPADFEGALGLFRRSLELRTEVRELDPDDAANSVEILNATDWVGLAAHMAGKTRLHSEEWDIASETFVAAVNAREVLAAREPTARRFHELGVSLLELGVVGLRAPGVGALPARFRFQGSRHWLTAAGELDPTNDRIALDLAIAESWIAECDRTDGHV